LNKGRNPCSLSAPAAGIKDAIRRVANAKHFVFIGVADQRVHFLKHKTAPKPVSVKTK
jgi:hypothetical protein